MFLKQSFFLCVVVFLLVWPTLLLASFINVFSYGFWQNVASDGSYSYEKDFQNCAEDCKALEGYYCYGFSYDFHQNICIYHMASAEEPTGPTDRYLSISCIYLHEDRELHEDGEEMSTFSCTITPKLRDACQSISRLKENWT